MDGKDNKVSYAMQLFHYRWRLASQLKAIPHYVHGITYIDTLLIVISMQAIAAVPYPSQGMS